MTDLRVLRRSPALVLAFCAALQVWGCKSKPKGLEATALRGTVQRLVGQGAGASLEICDPRGNACAAATVGSAIPAGSVLRTGPRASAQIGFADGRTLALDHDSELSLPSNGGKHARLSQGSLVLELAAKPQVHARFDVNDGSIELSTGKAALRAGSDFAVLDVIRGQASLSAADGKPLAVNAGEEARLYRGSAPYVSAGAALSDAVSFTESLLEHAESGALSKGLGELTAQKPGSSDEQRGVVRLAAHSVRVRIAGAMART
jgi:ferric-dicitrate binding protein FerR (iron transport regulator)